MSMLPSSTDYDTTLNSLRVKPSKTYYLNFDTGEIGASVDDDSRTLYQFVRKALSIDKYAWCIYDWLYGNELYNLAGKDYQYIVTVLPDIVDRALLSDDRVKEVKNYKFEKQSIDSMLVTFDVVGINATITYTQEVSY